MGWTDGIKTSCSWIMLLPVISAATSLGLVGAIAATVLACSAYLSFLAYLKPDQFIPLDQLPEILMRSATFPIAEFLVYQLLEANRIAARKYQTAAEQLAEANKHLQ